MIKGLDSLPRDGLAGEFMVGIMGSMLLKDDPIERDKWRREQEIERFRKKQESILLEENIKVLQAKLIRLKRILTESNLMSQLSM